MPRSDTEYPEFIYTNPVISAPALSLRDAGQPDWLIGGIEGPFVIKRHGAYWMFFSAWTRGYEIGVLRADSPLGP